MPFQLSPGVNVTEVDLTTIVPAVSTTTGAIAGVFRWGPAEQPRLITSEDELVQVFGKPSANNFETFYTAANFLAYGNQLYVTRTASENAFNAWGGDAQNSNVSIKNLKDYEIGFGTSPNNQIHFVAKYPGELGNSLKVSVCPSPNAYSVSVKTINPADAISFPYFVGNVASLYTMTLGSNTATVNVYCDGDAGDDITTSSATFIRSQLAAADIIDVGNISTGKQTMNITTIGSVSSPSIVGNRTSVTFTINFDDTFKQRKNINIATANGQSNIFTRQWEYYNLVNKAPGTSNYVATRNTNTAVKDELHIVVEDRLGQISGTPGQILEVWQGLSRANDAKNDQGASIYYRDVINKNSKYIWSTSNLLTNAVSTDVTFGGVVEEDSVSTSYTFSDGYDGLSESEIEFGDVAMAYDYYKSAEDIDVSLILTGKSAHGDYGEQLPNYIIDNIAESRRDCVVFVSPSRDAVVNNVLDTTGDLITFRDALRSTSYAVLDSGYKYQYDKYNDTYRWVPLNGDVAGLCARTDQVRDPWFSPAGFNRGNIKNVIKLAFNPDKGHRDQLYKNGINPVVNFPGQGVILFGDKTLLAQPSAFDRINVRRLFIVLEKAIAKAAQSSLFEFNDEFTRAFFRNLIEPYLRDIQGRRGIYDFRVVCDDTNNTPEVIDRNEFRGDIYVKPARSINFIQLNFIAVRTGVEFDEIVGKF
jgi:hypothetical protein